MAVPVSTRDQVRAHTDRAVAALQRGALDEASREFAQAIYLSPRDVVLRQRLGDLLARMGRTQAAVRQFQHVAGHYAAEGQLLKAIAICRVILEMEPAHVETQNTLAELYSLQHESMPMVPRLPPSMSGAARGKPAHQEPSAPLHGPAIPTERFKLPERPAQDAPTEAAPVVDDSAETQLEELPAVTLDLAAIGRAPLFSNLERDVFLAVLQKLDLRWVTAGEVIAREGETALAMYIVVQGLVHVVRGEPKPGSQPVAVLSEGSFFGEMALVSRAPRLASVVAAKDGLLFAVSQTAYDALAAAHPSIRKVVEEFYRERLLANLLAVSPLFRAFGQDQKRQVAARFKLHQFASGEPVLLQGKPGAGLFIVLRGECEVFHTDEVGEQSPYPPLREGEVFGEISLLFGSLCTATVRAGTRCDVLELPKADFDQLVLPHPSIKSIVDRIARERLARTADLLLVHDTLPISWLV